MQAVVASLKFASLLCMQLKFIILPKANQCQKMIMVKRIIKLHSYASGFWIR